MVVKMVNIARNIPKSMHKKVLKNLLNTFPDNELDSLIEVIQKEKERRNNEKK